MVKLLAHLSPKENSIEKYFLLLFWGLETIQISRYSQAILTWSILFPCWQNISQCILTPFVKKIYLLERHSDWGWGREQSKEIFQLLFHFPSCNSQDWTREKLKAWNSTWETPYLGPCKLVSTSRYMNCSFILALWFS